MHRYFVYFSVLTAVLTVPLEASPQNERLEKVVIVQRHGVRAPTKSDTELSQYSREPWQKWPVAPGELTDKGASGAEAMGRSIAKFYRAHGLLRNPEQDVFIWSDSADTRTVQSGDAVARGFHRTKGAAHAGKSTDSLFSAHDAGICPPARADIERTLTNNNESDINALGGAYEKAVSAMAQLLYPGINKKFCAINAHKACLFISEKNAIKGDGWDTKMTGPLATGSSLSENLLLEYAQGFPAPGWGRATETRITEIMALHNIYSRLMRANKAVAGRRGAALAQSIVDQLTDKPSDFTDAAPVPADAKLVLYLGHDGNLSNMAGIYDLHWKLPGQPDDTAPNTAMAFERWRDAQGHPYVHVRLFYQTLAEQRRKTYPSAHIQDIVVSNCQEKSGQCPLQAFAEQTLRNTEATCLTHKPLKL